jgi:diphthamide biosynthesis protein 7
MSPGSLPGTAGTPTSSTRVHIPPCRLADACATTDFVFFPGGDDCKLKGWDVRTAEDELPIWTNKRFDAGVTCIQTSPHRPNVVAVGSYNSTLTLLDPRYPSRPLIDPIDIGGGAWRVKWHPSAERSNDILVACMHDGFKVVRLGTEAEGGAVSVVGSELLTRFDGHESLAYGADWSYATKATGGETLVGSASFYDHLVQLWSA